MDVLQKAKNQWYCIVKACAEKSKRADEAKFHLFPFPRVEPTRRIWIENVNLGDDFKPTKYTCVCGKHFADGRPTTENPYPDVDVGWSCPKRARLDLVRDDLTRPTVSRMVVESRRNYAIKVEARRLLGLPEGPTPEEIAIKDMFQPVVQHKSSYSDYCSAVGCPNSAYVLKKLGVSSCRYRLFQFPKNVPIAKRWASFAQLNFSYSVKRGQLCELHFVNGEPTDENPVPTLYPDFELVTKNGSKTFELKERRNREEQSEDETSTYKDDVQDHEQEKQSEDKTVNEDGDHDAKQQEHSDEVDKDDKSFCSEQPSNLAEDRVDKNETANSELQQNQLKQSDNDRSLSIEKILSDENGRSLFVEKILRDETFCVELTGLSPRALKSLFEELSNDALLNENSSTEVDDDKGLASGLLGLIITLTELTCVQSDKCIFVSKIFKRWISFLANHFRSSIVWPKGIATTCDPQLDEEVRTVLGHNRLDRCSKVVGILDCLKSSAKKFLIVYDLKGVVIYRSFFYDVTLSDADVVEAEFERNLHSLLNPDEILLCSRHVSRKVEKLKVAPVARSRNIIRQRYESRLKKFAYIFTRELHFDRDEPACLDLLTVSCGLVGISSFVSLDNGINIG